MAIELQTPQVVIDTWNRHLNLFMNRDAEREDLRRAVEEINKLAVEYAGEIVADAVTLRNLLKESTDE